MQNAKNQQSNLNLLPESNLILSDTASVNLPKKPAFQIPVPGAPTYEQMEAERLGEYLFSMKSYFSQAILVSVELAEYILRFNDGNRKVSENDVARYADLMERGEFPLTGEPVILTDAHLCRDGQHRLLALVRYGKPVLMAITAGIEDRTYVYLNQGVRRSGGDVLSMEKYKHASIIAGGIREYAVLLLGMKQTSELNGKRALSNADIARMASIIGKEKTELVATFASSYYHFSRFYTPSQLFAFILYLDQIHPNKWKEFFDKVFEKLNLQKETAEYALVNLIQREENNKDHAIRVYIKRAWFIKAFNNSLSNKKTSKLQFHLEREEYPKFQRAKNEPKKFLLFEVEMMERQLK